MTQADKEITEFRFVVDEDTAGMRLDVFLAEKDDPPISRSQVKKRITRGEVRVDGAHTKAGHKLRVGEQVVWDYEPPTPLSADPQDIPLDVLWEDDHAAVVNKPAGMVVHPAPGHPDGTLVNAILFHFSKVAETGATFRPGIVHRIDKDTSGAIVVTKTLEAHHHLAALFHDHDIERAYHALVVGPGLDDEGTFDTLHGRDPNHRKRFTSRVDKGRRAVTHYRVLERFRNGACLVECRLETGRTHQIRMHLSEAHAPLLADPMYGGRKVSQSRLIDRQALHARTLGFRHIDGSEVHVEAPYPDDFASALEALRAGKEW